VPNHSATYLPYVEAAGDFGITPAESGRSTLLQRRGQAVPGAIGASRLSYHRAGGRPELTKGDSMAECFLFFRFWPGFTDSFPVDRFNTLTDEELPAALKSFALTEIRRPEIWKQVKEVRKRRKAKAIAGLRRQSAQRLGGGPVMGRWRAKRVSLASLVRGADRDDPWICRLGAYLDWWSRCGCDSSYAFGPRVSSQESAEMIVSYLNSRKVDYHGNELEHHLRPRFGFLEDLAADQQVSAQRCIDAIQRGNEPDVCSRREALVMGQKAIRIADELMGATRTLGLEKDTDSQRGADHSVQANGNASPTPPATKPEQGEGNGGKGTTKHITRWERLKKWALNKWVVVAFLAISAVVIGLTDLGSGLVTLFNWMRCFIDWLQQ